MDNYIEILEQENNRLNSLVQNFSLMNRKFFTIKIEKNPQQPITLIVLEFKVPSEFKKEKFSGDTFDLHVLKTLCKIFDTRLDEQSKRLVDVCDGTKYVFDTDASDEVIKDIVCRHLDIYSV
jgi:hypothetical protein